MKPKSCLTLDFLLALIVIMILAISAFTSCTYQKINVEETEDQGQLAVLNDSDIVIVVGDNETINMSEEPKPEPAGQVQERTPEEKPEQETDEVPTVPIRASEVEFYFLLTGKSYFKATQKEGQAKTYNVSGELITINPIFIGNDEVKFKINDYTTEAIEEKEWGTTPEFEIFVSFIYYRP